MDVSDKIIDFTQEHFELRFVVYSAKQMTVGSDDHFDESRCRPIFTKQAAKNRSEVITDLHLTEFGGTVLSDLVWFTHGRSYVLGSNGILSMNTVSLICFTWGTPF
jgi:hypothetical protein